jgi:hypothetical protein
MDATYDLLIRSHVPKSAARGVQDLRSGYGVLMFPDSSERYLHTVLSMCHEVLSC